MKWHGMWMCHIHTNWLYFDKEKTFTLKYVSETATRLMTSKWWHIHVDCICIILSGSINGTDCVANVTYSSGYICKPPCLICWLGSHRVMDWHLLIIFMRSRLYPLFTITWILWQLCFFGGYIAHSIYEQKLVITPVGVMFNHGLRDYMPLALINTNQLHHSRMCCN